MDIDRYSLEDLCKMYVRYVFTCKDGYYRVMLHNAIANKLGVDTVELNRVLHNLDRYVGYNQEFEYSMDDVELLDEKGRKLYEILISIYR